MDSAAAIRQWWCELAWLGGERATARVAITTTGDRITAVAAGVDAPPASTVLRGLTLPGIANGHSHAFHRALRGRTHGGQGTFWTWREQMYRAAQALDPDAYRELATVTFTEMALAGYTALGEFHYLHHGPGGRPYADPNEMGSALIEAAAAAGVRITLLDTCYLHGGLSAQGYEALNEVQLRFADPDVDAWAQRVEALRSQWNDAPHARVGAAIHSVRAVDPTAAAAVVAAANVWSVPLHAHVSEQPAENEACAAAYGRTPTDLLASVGALDASGGFTAVHATHLGDADMAAYGRARTTCCFCPTTERDLADGTGPAIRLLAAGARLSIGSDSNTIIDPFEEARAIELNERMRTNVRGNLGVELLATAATSDGMASIGWGESGRIATSGLADFVSIDLEDPSLAGIDPEHALAATMHAASPRAVHHVVIGANVVVREGRHLSVPDHVTRRVRAIRTLLA